tara:strand:- start:11970 stop:12539 length:570 start_codon:yes stop_codon:yes gene_type:complete
MRTFYTHGYVGDVARLASRLEKQSGVKDWLKDKSSRFFNWLNEKLPIFRKDQFDGVLEDNLGEEELPDIQEVPEATIETPPIEEPVPAHDPEADVPEADKDYPDFENSAEAIAWAEQNQEAVKIYYQTKGGVTVEREVEPHGEFFAKTTGNQILVTFDRTAGDIRAFIVPNIMYHMFMGDRFEPKFAVK